MAILHNRGTAALVLRAGKDAHTVPPAKFVDGKQAPGTVEVSDEFWQTVKGSTVVNALLAAKTLIALVPKQKA